MDIMGNDKKYAEQLFEALKERVGEGMTPLEDNSKLVGTWNVILVGLMDLPDEPCGTMEFFGDGKWSDGDENPNVEYKIPEKGILIRQYEYGEIPETNDPGGICEEADYAFVTTSGRIVLSNSDSSVVFKLTRS